MGNVLAIDVGGIPVLLIIALLCVVLARPAMILVLPDEMCGPGGWLIDTDQGGLFGDCDGDGDGGD